MKKTLVSRIFPPTLGLGIAQIIIWGGSFFLLAVMAKPISLETGWSQQFIYATYSMSIFVSGALSPFIGRTIAKNNSKYVLSIGALLVSVGLILMGCAVSKTSFVASWIIIGAGMAAGLYDALFSSLGKILRENARKAITQVTLISGFSSTITWPIIAVMIENLGWRDTCFIYSLINLVICIPIYIYHVNDNIKLEVKKITSNRSLNLVGEQKAVYMMMTLTFTLAAAIMTIVSVQLIPVMQFTGVSLEKSIFIASLIGPSQVLARVIELLFMRTAHPKWSTILSTILVLTGLILFIISPLLSFVAIVIYGAGSGLRTVVRGTLPMSLFGAENYPIILGKVARPVLFTQAISPFIAAWFMEKFGAHSVLYLLLSLALISFMVSMVLIRKLNTKEKTVTNL